MYTDLVMQQASAEQIPGGGADDSRPPRILPALDDANRAFWTGGAEGQLLIMRDQQTGRWIHPADPDDVASGMVRPEAVSGRGTVFTFTVNAQQYHPEVPPPYVIAIVTLEEQDDLRLPTNIVGCDPGEVHVGMPVEVVFEQHGDVHVPLFRPCCD
jgi:uncharacterized protein